LKKRTKKRLVPQTIRLAHPQTLPTAMTAKAAVHALRAIPRHSKFALVRPTAHAEGNEGFLASFFSKKEVSHALDGSAP
jgi:hypothetical protein